MFFCICINILLYQLFRVFTRRGDIFHLFSQHLSLCTAGCATHLEIHKNKYTNTTHYKVSEIYKNTKTQKNKYSSLQNPGNTTHLESVKQIHPHLSLNFCRMYIV